MSSPTISFAILVVALALVLGSGAPRTEAARAFFVFGDSLVDSGNNNYLLTSARADSPPYGIDYPTHRPTGRFSNGLNIPDLISQEIGSEPTLPYLSPELNGRKLLVGANFASAGIGILNDTGIQFKLSSTTGCPGQLSGTSTNLFVCGTMASCCLLDVFAAAGIRPRKLPAESTANIIRITQQIQYFQAYQQRVSALIGPQQTQRLVNGALVLITLGGNDFVNNYFLTPVSARRLQYSLPSYSRYLISEYRKILMRLYDLGCRRVLVTGTGPLGCVPAELATRSTNGQCAEEPQQAAAIFNPLLIQMIKGLNQEVGSNVFIAANANEMQNNFINNPQAFGFVTSKVACCGQGPYNGVGLCNPTSNLCPNRDIYAFWDPFHPTERANKLIVQTISTGSDKYMYPMNLSTIMALDAML